MAFQGSVFQDPPREMGPLAIRHNVVTEPKYNETDRETARERYRLLKKLGYSGVVTNIPFENGYLENEDNWKVLHAMLQAADDEGMRLWLYDEKGYPSGAAGGITLRENPDWEAKGIVCLTEYASHVEIPLPKGHIRFVAAFAYDGTDLSHIDYASAQPLPLDDVIRYDGEPKLVAAIVLKPCFEMTHAAQNVHSIRRYVDVCDKEAIQAFIRNTYQAYYDHEKEFFGGRFEAIFTDEPSYMAPYIDNGNPKEPEAYASGQGSRWHIPMEDRIDPSIPLYATLPWTAAVEEKFDRKLYPALFGGDSETAKRARWAYHKEMSRLYGENFFGQLGAWCDAHGIAFSGHILLEDDITYHPVYEGDFFEKLKHMKVPGIDLLYASPERAFPLMLTPKLVSSIAHRYGIARVMSESSAHFEKSNQIPLSHEERMCSAAMQYACGVTLIDSYYGDTEMTLQEYNRFCDFLKRLTYLCEAGKHAPSCALYYPIDSLYVDMLPSETPLWQRVYPENYARTAKFYQSVGLDMLKEHAEFDIVNTEALVNCRVEKGALVTEHGETFRAVVIPPLSAVDADMVEKLNEAADNGVKLVAVACDPIGNRDLDGAYQTLLNKATVVATAAEAAKAARELSRPTLTADADWMLSHIREYEDHTVILMVNMDASAHETDLALDRTGKTHLLRPDGGSWETMAVPPTRLCFAPYETLALWIEK